VAASGGASSLSVELSDAPENRLERGSPQARAERDEMPQPRQERDEMPPPRQEREGVAAGKPPDIQQRVVMLHNAGFAASLIASRVGVPLGEVELIIALQQRKGRA
jgi:DNA-directed RNA polymerase specialized sigma24 family protein